MNRLRTVHWVLLLSLGVAASAEADPISVLMQRVASALGRHDITAFDRLVVPKQSFNWEISLAPVILRYQCRNIERWSFTEIEHPETYARVRLTIDGQALRAGSGTPAAMPRAWIAELQQVDGQWYLRSLLTIERDLAQRIVRACPDERHSLFESDPDADQHELPYQIAESATAEFLGHREDLPAVRCAVAFAREEAERIGDLGDEAVGVSPLAGTLRIFGMREESLSLATEIFDLAERSGQPDALATAYFSRGLGRWVNGDDAG